MIYRINPKNGDELSALGFGCMRLPELKNSIDYDRSEAMIISAIDQGINYFDTAYIYQSGKGETVLGQVLAKGYRDRVKIATKIPPVHGQKPRGYGQDFQQAAAAPADRLDRLLPDPHAV